MRGQLWLGAMMLAACVPELRIVHRDGASEIADAVESPDVVTAPDVVDAAPAVDVVDGAASGDAANDVSEDRAADATTMDASDVTPTEDRPDAALPDAAEDTLAAPDAAADAVIEDTVIADTVSTDTVSTDIVAADRVDALVVVDAAVADRVDVVDVAVAEIVAPRPVGPLSASVIGSGRPTLRWALPPSATGAEVTICADRACRTVQQTLRVDGATGVPTALPRGVWYWKLRGTRDGSTGRAESPVWEFQVAGDAARDDVWGQLVDVDGDARADLIASAPGARSLAGRVHGYLRATVTSSVPTWSIDSPAPAQADFGWSVAMAGDVNGDGFSDLLVGAPSVGGRGVTYVFPGSAAGPASTPSATMSESTSPVAFGWCVTGLGDLNGDGFADIGVSAIGTADTGRVYVYAGSAAGLSARADAVLSEAGAEGAYFGHSLAALGDIDGDGLGDFAVGAPRHSTQAGRVFVYHGRRTLTEIRTPDVYSAPMPGNFGYVVANLGDIDGDGYVELGVGAPGTLNTSGQWMGVGRAYLYRGRSTGLETTPTSVLTPTDSVGSAMGFSLAGGSDVNGDGRADFALGAPGLTNNRGAVYLYAAGALPVTMGPASVPGDEGDGTFAGFSLAMPGDLTGDGLSDLAASVVGSRAFSGRIVMFPGTRPGAITPPLEFFGPDGVNGRFGLSIAH